MGTDKNIKLHIVTDIKTQTIRRCLQVHQQNSQRRKLLKREPNHNYATQCNERVKVNFSLVLWFHHLLHCGGRIKSICHREEYFEMAENYDHKYTEGFNFSMIPKEVEDD